MSFTGSRLSEMFAKNISRSIVLETLRQTLRKWIETAILADSVALVKFSTMILPLIIDGLAEEADSGLTDLEQATTEATLRLRDIHAGLQQQLDLDN